jgi:hypothetical protein
LARQFLVGKAPNQSWYQPSDRNRMAVKIDLNWAAAQNIIKCRSLPCVHKSAKTARYASRNLAPSN